MRALPRSSASRRVRHRDRASSKPGRDAVHLFVRGRDGVHRFFGGADASEAHALACSVAETRGYTVVLDFAYRSYPSKEVTPRAPRSKH